MSLELFPGDEEPGVNPVWKLDPLSEPELSVAEEWAGDCDESLPLLAGVEESEAVPLRLSVPADEWTVPLEFPSLGPVTHDDSVAGSPSEESRGEPWLVIEAGKLAPRESADVTGDDNSVDPVCCGTTLDAVLRPHFTELSYRDDPQLPSDSQLDNREEPPDEPYEDEFPPGGGGSPVLCGGGSEGNCVKETSPPLEGTWSGNSQRSSCGGSAHSSRGSSGPISNRNRGA